MDLLLAVTNVVGIIAFSVAGSLKAIERRMDLLGVLTLGFSTSLAGGIIADVLLGKFPPSNLTEVQYPAIAIISSAMTFAFFRKVSKLRRPLLYADALGLGAFTASGASLAYSVDPNPVLVTLVGTITAVGGGVLRDVLANEIPLVLTRDFYATAAIIGSLTYYALAYLGLFRGYLTAVVLLLTFALRVAAIRGNWRLPTIAN
ncbi:MAG: trimeric intracellular cation channel family protein [Sulfolobales archaeon]|nr:trimeric intracellular cation channel family protein [Sulfolobales archaeon]MCG2894426.1 trimeric intracellular cation channel family protein [Sulfolobales archaeon]MCG2911468.1 trimeric intracellular cation channel family protein [Sulfolobales archaeon]